MKRLLFYLTVLALAFTACAEFEEPIQINESGDSVATSPQTRAGAIVFETLENPYSLTRMRRLTGNSNLQHTDLYVRFKPQDSIQLNRLENTLDLELFDYPLDLNIEDGEAYVDLTIPSGGFTWQYTVFPTNFVFPAGITYETFV